MRRNRFTFAFFAAAILIWMIREWSAPASYARADLMPTVIAQPTR